MPTNPAIDAIDQTRVPVGKQRWIAFVILEVYTSDSTSVEINSAKISHPSDTSQLCDPVLPVEPTGQEEKSSSSSHPPFKKDFSPALEFKNGSLARSSERGPSPNLHDINNSQLSERSPRRVERPEQEINTSSRSHPSQVSSRNVGTSVPCVNYKSEATDAPT